MTDFDCDRFVLALDAGLDPALRARAVAHAASCDACAGRLAAESAVAALFASAPAFAPALPALPAGFTDRVMARVAHTPQDDVIPARASAPVPLPAATAQAVPWWIRAVAHPASALALVLAGVGIVFAPQLLGASRAAPQWSAQVLTALARLFEPLLRAPAPPATAPRLDPLGAVTFLPLIALLAVVLYRFGTALATSPLVAPLAGTRRRRA